MIRRLKRYTALALTITVLLLSGATGASAPQGSAYPHFMPDKEEVVYALLDAQGGVQDVYVVNSFILASPCTIEDYGSYTNLINLSTEDEIKQDGDNIRISTTAQKLYYQGTLQNVALPWNIRITYTLNGESISPEQLAGKTGALAIRINITKNIHCPGNFYEANALQVSLTLDTTLCSNIQAKGATLANAGKNKQINFTVLPGKGLSADITADVVDFEMERMQINGIGLSLDLDIDSDKFIESFNELSNGIEKLNDGAGDLSDGMKKIYKAAVSLEDAAKELNNGVIDFDSGLAELQVGTEEFRDGLRKLVQGALELKSGFSELDKNASSIISGSEQIQAGLNQILAGMGGSQGSGADLNMLAQSSTLINTGLAGLSAGLGQMPTSINAGAVTGQNESAINALTSVLSDPMLSSAAQAAITDAITALATSNIALDGAQNALNGIPSLKQAADTLSSNYGQIDGALQALPAQLSGLTQLQQGLQQLAANYATFHSGLKEYTQGVQKAIAGYSEILQGLMELRVGADELLDGIVKLKDGSFDLADGTAQLYEGFHTFRTGIGKLTDGVNELQEGTQEFYDETQGMDTKVDEQIDSMIAELSGSDFPLTSFASTKNTAIKSVQFVIAVEGIAVPEEDDKAPEPEPEHTFWTRLLALFNR